MIKLPCLGLSDNNGDVAGSQLKPTATTEQAERALSYQGANKRPQKLIVAGLLLIALPLYCCVAAEFAQ